jgi:large subunit ribosomal protein L16
MMQPKRRKYRKEFRGTRTGKATRGAAVNFGEFGIKALSPAWLTARQIEAARKTIAHETKRAGKLWIRVFPTKPITHKPAGVKMGGGKGDIEEYVAVIRPGNIIFELGGLTLDAAKEAFRKAGHKLPFRTQFVERG